MSLPHSSPINQNAYVVASIEQSVAWWTRVMGVGPFLILRDIVFARSDYRGQEIPVTYSAAIAYSGDLNIELIEPNGVSIFDDWLREGRTGVHHLCVFTEDFASTEADLLQRGGKRLQGGVVGGGLIAYYQMGGAESVILELAQMAPAGKAMFAAIHAACAKWDGKTPYLEAAELAALATGS